LSEGVTVPNSGAKPTGDLTEFEARLVKAYCRGLDLWSASEARAAKLEAALETIASGLTQEAAWAVARAALEPGAEPGREP
jgi:hypothetical protein